MSVSINNVLSSTSKRSRKMCHKKGVENVPVLDREEFQASVAAILLRDMSVSEVKGWLEGEDVAKRTSKELHDLLMALKLFIEGTRVEVLVKAKRVVGVLRKKARAVLKKVGKKKEEGDEEEKESAGEQGSKEGDKKEEESKKKEVGAKEDRVQRVKVDTNLRMGSGGEGAK
jgi:hypothetical protein